MKLLTLGEATGLALCCEALECHRQIWKHGSSWEGYVHTPRFSDGLMLVCSPIRVTFRQGDGALLVAGEGDVIYAPEGSLYRVEFERGGGDPDLFTFNFRLREAGGDAVRLSESLCRLSALTPECRLLAEELSVLFLSPVQNQWHRQAKLLELLAAVADAGAVGSVDFYRIGAGVRLLQSEWNKNDCIARYATACHMSASGFYRYFRAWSGLSPNEYRIRMRISAARSMLCNSAMSVQEIAFRVGFTDPYYFSRCFCKMTGVSPRAFRRSFTASRQD